VKVVGNHNHEWKEKIESQKLLISPRYVSKNNHIYFYDLEALIAQLQGCLLDCFD